MGGWVWSSVNRDCFARKLPKGDLLAAFAGRFREGFVQGQAGSCIVVGGHYGHDLDDHAGGHLYGDRSVFRVCGSSFTAMDGLQGTWSTWTITLTGMSTIPTPGFVGVFEGSCSIGLFLWGIEPDIGRTFALVLHAGQLGFIVVLGSIFMVVEGLSLRDLVQKRDGHAAETDDLIRHRQ